MMDDNIANNIILSSGISLKEAFDNEVRAYKSNDQVIERLCYHSGKKKPRWYNINGFRLIEEE